MIILKTTSEIQALKRGGAILASILKTLEHQTVPGISTQKLENIANELFKKHNVRPSFKGYNAYPAGTCVSLNNEVVHGLPKQEKIINQGDIVSIDCGIFYKNLCTDSAITFSVGAIDEETKKLINVTKESLLLGINAARIGNRVGDIGFAVSEHVEKNGFNVIKNLVGHGVGKHVHEEPQIPNYGEKGTGVELKAGMVLAIEPMVTTGSEIAKLQNDGWTFATQSGTKSAHFEHTIAITKKGPIILTK